MAKCGCGATCSCVLTAGPNVQIDGRGTADSPWVISSGNAFLSVSDSATINLTLSGDGTVTNPWNIIGDFIGTIQPPDWTPAESRTWSGAVSMADVTAPRTIRVTMNGNVSAVTMPTWLSSNSGRIFLMISQDATGGRTWVMPGTSSNGVDIVLSTAPNARDLIECFWTGIQWVLSARAMAVA